METLYLSLGKRHALYLLISCVTFLSAAFNASSQELVFSNYTLEPGPAAGADGATYRFTNVINGVDALIKIKDRSGSDVVLQNIDVNDNGWNKAFQPQLGVNGNILGLKNWWMEFELRFVKPGTTSDVNVGEFNITALDIDGDGLTIQEYAEFYKTKTAILENITQLIATPLGNSGNEKDYRFTGPLLNFLNIDTGGTAVMATTKYENKNKINFRLGAKALGLGTSNAGMRFNSLWFRSFNYVAPRTLPMDLIAFNAGLINKKVVLNWTTSQEKNASHFVIQRSTDGIEFSDAGIVFTDGNSEVEHRYDFKDPKATEAKGVWYYRLKMVDVDGRFEYSQVRLVKMGDVGAKLELQAFPNPVVSELRITIPAGWQNKPVVYAIYSGDGQLVKTWLTKMATQTETVNVQFYTPGAYIIKAYNENEIATQRVIKRR